jgi:hypothetical protein
MSQARSSSRNPRRTSPTAVVAPGTGVPGVSALVVGKLRLSKYAFNATTGTTISYQNNLGGTTTLTVSPKGSTASLWRLVHSDTNGVNTLKFIDGKLAKGFYTLTTTTTFSGLPAATNLVTMRVLSGPSHTRKRRNSRRH